MPSDATQHDIAMMQLALEQAKAAVSLDEVPVGAVVYRGDCVLAWAHNRRESLQDPTAHAEILALRAAAQKIGSWRMEGCTLAVTLEPCPMCAGALVNARVPRLVYGCADPKMGCVDSLHRLCTDRRFNHRLEVIPGLMAQECAQLLRLFFQKRRSNRFEDTRPRPCDA